MHINKGGYRKVWFFNDNEECLFVPKKIDLSGMDEEGSLKTKVEAEI